MWCPGCGEYEPHGTNVWIRSIQILIDSFYIQDMGGILIMLCSGLEVLMGKRSAKYVQRVAVSDNCSDVLMFT